MLSIFHLLLRDKKYYSVIWYQFSLKVSMKMEAYAMI